jgi:two-component sensor histidine kinase
LSDRLNEASTRISAVGRAYERLAYNADYESIGLASYLREVIDDLETAVAPCKVQLEVHRGNSVRGDRAILVALSSMN